MRSGRQNRGLANTRFGKKAARLTPRIDDLGTRIFCLKAVLEPRREALPGLEAVARDQAVTESQDKRSPARPGSARSEHRSPLGGAGCTGGLLTTRGGLICSQPPDQ